MQRLFLLSLLSIFVPTVCFADMVGYSGDTRRYVTDAEKTQFPYNTVVRLETWKKGRPYSSGTGTFISKRWILTCYHVVDRVEFAKDGIAEIKYYTPDGRQNVASVFKKSGIWGDKGEKNSTDVAFVFSPAGEDFPGPVLRVSSRDKESNNVMMIGYDSLKVLSKTELSIVKQVYAAELQKIGKFDKNSFEYITNSVENTLREKYSCSSISGQNKCVHCSVNGGCIFEDHKNMKVRTGCKAKINDGILITNCPGSPGASGSAFIDSNTNEIIGVMCAVYKSVIGQDKHATTIGVLPSKFKPATDQIINAGQ